MTCSERRTGERGPILGYTTRRHLILDLDSSGLPYAMRIARLIQEEWPRVGDCLILQSSEPRDRVRLAYNKWGRVLMIHDRPHHHLIFDGLIGYNTASRVCRTLAALNVLEPDYDRIREFRGDMTLRVGPAVLMEKVKPVPHVVARVHSPTPCRRGGYIGDFVKFLKIGERLFLFEDLAEGVPDHGADAADDGGQHGSIDSGV